MPEPIPYVDLFGVVAIRKSRGPGWEVGVPGLRMRDGKPARKIVGLRHVSSSAEAIDRATSGLPPLIPEALTREPLDSRERAIASLSASLTVEALLAFPLVLKAARIGAGLRQSDLAELAGTHQATVSKIELGERDPSFSMARRLLASLPR